MAAARQALNSTPHPRKWRGLHRLIGLEDKLEIARMCGWTPHPGQLTIMASRARNRVSACGRRFGKSEMSSVEAITCAVLGGYWTCAGPTYDHADITWRTALDLLMGGELRPLVHSVRQSKGDQQIILKTGGTIDARTTMKPRSLLGRGRDGLGYDESALDADEVAWVRYARPSLSDHEGAALFTSTPNGDDWFKGIFEKGLGGDAEWESFTMPSSANPLMTASEIAAAQADLPETIFRQEYLAEFLDAQGAVFRGYRDAATAQWQDHAIAGHVYTLGVDLAMHEDWTVIAIFDVTERAVVHLIRFNQIDYPMQERMIVEAVNEWRPAGVLVDATNNEGTWQHIRDAVHTCNVDPFKFTAISKAEVIHQLAVGIEKQHLALLSPGEHQDSGHQYEVARTALQEFGAYRYDRTPSGNLRMNAPSGRHDDIVIAVALAYAQALRSAGGLPIVHTVNIERLPMMGRFGRQKGRRL